MSCSIGSKFCLFSSIFCISIKKTKLSAGGIEQFKPEIIFMFYLLIFVPGSALQAPEGQCVFYYMLGKVGVREGHSCVALHRRPLRLIRNAMNFKHFLFISFQKKIIPIMAYERDCNCVFCVPLKSLHI